MFKFNLLLTLILVMCALSVVFTQNESRKLNMALENEQKITRKLNLEWKKLQLEQSTLIARRKIEHEAKKHLGMDMPMPNQVQIISSATIGESHWAKAGALHAE